MSYTHKKMRFGVGVVMAVACLLFASSSWAGKDAAKPWTPRKDCTGVYGTKTQAKSTKITLAALHKAPHLFDNQLLQVSGTIKSACKVKGCWMIITDGKHKMRVRFKGYGFFVPTNSAGYRAVVVGKAKAKTISVKMLRHYAMDAGKPALAKSITKPKKTIAFTAHWVALHKVKAPAKTAPTAPAPRK